LRISNASKKTNKQELHLILLAFGKKDGSNNFKNYSL